MSGAQQRNRLLVSVALTTAIGVASQTMVLAAD
jgi:hypothetical protein